MKKNGMTVALAFAMAFIMTACSEKAGDNTVSLSTANPLGISSKGWVDSDLIGSISENDDIRLQDDFAAAVNKEWKLQRGDKFANLFQDASDDVMDKMKKAVTDKSIHGTEAEALRRYYALSSDWNHRNSQGTAPLIPYLDDIRSISSMDELYSFFMDLERNPLAISPVSVGVTSTYHTEKYPDINLTVVASPELSLSDGYGAAKYGDLSSIEGLELYEAIESKALYMLEQMGYSEKDARRIFRDCLIWEKKVAKVSEQVSIDLMEDYIVPRDEAVSLAGAFPLEELLDAWGYDGAEYIVISPRYAKKLSSLCKESNLEKIKAFLIVNYCLNSAAYLDRQTYDTFKTLSASKTQEPMDMGMSDEQLEDNLQFKSYICGTSMLGAMNKVYVENYFDDSAVSELTGMTQDIIDAFKEIFAGEEWMTPEGREAAIEKIDNIKIHIAHQNFEVLDYSHVSFPSKEEGGSFLEAYFAAKRYSVLYSAFLSEQRFDRDFWDPLDEESSTTLTNAFYNPATNGIYICAGICGTGNYEPDMTYEEKLAGLFTIVGHEITHGFDSGGSLYDKDGRKNTWLPYKDQMTFNDLNNKISSYYTTLSPYPGSGLYEGSRLIGEACADMGGIKVTLYLASKKPDFDYDLYFRSYAKLWRVNVPLEGEKSWFKGDTHPLPFYRTNVGLQQFDEFYETYGITESDGMYLAPEKRIKVW